MSKNPLRRGVYTLGHVYKVQVHPSTMFKSGALLEVKSYVWSYNRYKVYRTHCVAGDILKVAARLIRRMEKEWYKQVTGAELIW